MHCTQCILVTIARDCLALVSNRPKGAPQNSSRVNKIAPVMQYQSTHRLNHVWVSRCEAYGEAKAVLQTSFWWGDSSVLRVMLCLLKMNQTNLRYWYAWIAACCMAAGHIVLIEHYTTPGENAVLRNFTHGNSGTTQIKSDAQSGLVFCRGLCPTCLPAWHLRLGQSPAAFARTSKYILRA